MPILITDIKYRLSGGAAQSNPDASLGGAKSSVEMAANLFDRVPSVEAAAGRVEYRCIYVHNAHASLTLEGAKFWVPSNTPSAGTNVDVALGTSAVNGTEQTVANETTAPTGVSWVQADNEGAAITLGDIPAGQHRAVWLRRTVNPGTGAADDTLTLRTKGDTAA